MSTTIEQGVAHVEKSIFFIFRLKIVYQRVENVVVFFFLKYLFEIPKSTIFRDDPAQRKNQPFCAYSTRPQNVIFFVSH